MVMSDEEAQAHADQMTKHAQQVVAGVIPEDAPVDFVKPDDGENEEGQPWWWPPDIEFDPHFVAGMQDPNN